MAEFDLIVYGATGFTGKLVAEYVHATYPDCAWAMAGRSMDKLTAVRDELGLPADTPLIEADATSPETMSDMVRRGGVILTTVGPYQLYGEALVAACAAHGSDYVDLSGDCLLYTSDAADE